MPQRYDRTDYPYNQDEASDGAGNTKQFHFFHRDNRDGERELAERAAYEFAQSAGGFGYVVLMGRNRLNDHVGPPVWSDPEVIEEL